MINKVTPINEIKGIDLRFRHMTDGKGFKRKLDTGSMKFISSESVDYVNERSIYDKVPKETIDRFIDKQMESEKMAMKAIIKSCINSGKLITKLYTSNGKYRIAHIGEVLSYRYDQHEKKIDLMTVDCSNGYPKNIIYTGKFKKIDDETYIEILSRSINTSADYRGLIEIEV